MYFNLIRWANSGNITVPLFFSASYTVSRDLLPNTFPETTSWLKSGSSECLKTLCGPFSSTQWIGASWAPRRSCTSTSLLSSTWRHVLAQRLSPWPTWIWGTMTAEAARAPAPPTPRGARKTTSALPSRMRYWFPALRGFSGGRCLLRRSVLIQLQTCDMLPCCIFCLFSLFFNAFGLFIQATANNYLRNGYINYIKKPKQHSSQPDADTPNKWTFFCEFPEITHVAITDSNVCISTQDNLCMVRAFVSSLMWKL